MGRFQVFHKELKQKNIVIIFVPSVLTSKFLLKLDVGESLLPKHQLTCREWLVIATNQDASHEITEEDRPEAASAQGTAGRTLFQRQALPLGLLRSASNPVARK